MKEKRYTILEEEWASDKLGLGLDFPNVIHFINRRQLHLHTHGLKITKWRHIFFIKLPYLIDGNMKLTESRAILRHLARENSEALCPSTSEANRTVDMLENVIFDVWFALIRYCNYKAVNLSFF